MNTYLIKCKESVSERMLTQVTDMGATVVYRSPVLPVFAIRADKETAANVRSVCSPVYFIKSGNEGSLLKLSNLQNHHPSLQLVPGVEGKSLRKAGCTGWGVTVAVLDSGLSDHRASGHYDFTGYGPQPLLDHGDKVATILESFAPGAQLVSCKVAHGYHNLKQVALLQAIDFAVRRLKAQVVLMALGFHHIYCTAGDPCALCETVDVYARNSDVLFVTGAGNEGEAGEDTITCPGRAREAVTVGAVNAQEPQVAAYSSKGAAGSDKPNLVSSGTIYYRRATDYGTSFAAPVAAGVGAALMTGGRRNASEAKNLMYGTARKFEGVAEHHQGYGALDVGQLTETLADDE